MTERNSEMVPAFRPMLDRRVHAFGNLLVDGFHYLALFAIGAATVWSAFFAFVEMVGEGRAGVSDILLLFIYLEIGAMVGIYFKTNHLPVRYLIYISITVLARFMIETISLEHKSGWYIPVLSGSILLLALSALVLRYGSYRYPAYDPEQARGEPAREETASKSH